ncbi:MAG: ribosome biogenesis GTPase YlqF [Leptolyngbyaceae cyanobacterium T60_A2020_046]|nr:ribosome biogenesis GTPase YlqF [Leptolyngbyaceae cyanobacterium T60_A2020_046]
MSPLIQWYPGHIAKAEKALLEQLKRVDVVLEVRDARIPLATKHKRMEEWVGDRGRILVLNRVDMISPEARAAWEAWFRAQGEDPYFTNAQTGKGVAAVLKGVQTAGASVNERRRSRGMRDRPIRAVVIGFPNVGKSALINRLLKRKVVASARKAGVTRQLRWVRISDEIELLDAPGVLPAHLHDQDAALKLAICDDIGEAAYDDQRVAASLIDLMKVLDTLGPENPYQSALEQRYDLSLDHRTGETYLHDLAALRYQNNLNRTARTLLNDYRVGHLSALPLEWPIQTPELEPS